MKAATFLNLPVQPGRPRIVDLHPVNPQIMFLCDWVLGIDQRERDEWAAVLMPGSEHGQLVESHRWFDDFIHRTPRNVARTQFEKISHQRTMSPKFRPVRTQQRLSDAHQFLNERFRLRPKGEFDPFLCSKQIRDDWKATSLHLLEQQRRAAALDYAPMDLGDFEVRIDFGVDCDEIVFATQEIEERAKVRVH